MWALTKYSIMPKYSMPNKNCLKKYHVESV